jgi:hypothetical protein
VEQRRVELLASALQISFGQKSERPHVPLFVPLTVHTITLADHDSPSFIYLGKILNRWVASSVWSASADSTHEFPKILDN